MVRFSLTMGGHEVLVGGKKIGYIESRGFFTDPTVIREFMEVSPDDLRAIADKAEEITRIHSRTRLRAAAAAYITVP